LLTEDGVYKLRAYYQNAYDTFDGEYGYSGIALIFEREFDRSDKQLRRNAERVVRFQQRKASKNEQKQEKEIMRFGCGQLVKINSAIEWLNAKTLSLYIGIDGNGKSPLGMHRFEKPGRGRASVPRNGGPYTIRPGFCRTLLRLRWR
jgi:hypothetical protein